jgi:Ca-activated chloride channel homolog
MTFARIEMLFLIWAAPVLALIVAYGMRRRRKALSRFASPNGLAVIAPTSSARRRWVKGGLLIAGLAFLSLSLSGPRYGFRWQEIERRGVDILIALDCSRSMLARDLQPTRLDRAKREVLDLIAMLQGDRVGLAAFSGTAFLQCPLTLDYAAFHLFLEVLSPDYLPVGGTDITGALTVARNGFDPKSAAEKAVILITDGENTGRGDPVAAARKLDEAGITLFCIGVGGEEGVPVPAADGGFKKDREGQIVMTRLDEDLLQRMALLTGGTYVRSVAGDMDLDVVYRQEIRGKMEAAALAGGRKQVWEDRYQWFLALAILCVVVDLFLRPIRRTPGVAMGRLLCILCLLAGTLSPSPTFAGPLQEGVEAYDRGEYETALKRFIDAQLDAPDRPDILYNIGNAYYKLGDYEAALTHYKQALEKNPAGLEEKARYNKGNAHFRNKEYEAAIKAYEAALKIDPDDQQAEENLRFVRKVMEQQEQQQQQSGKEGDGPKKENETPQRNEPEQQNAPSEASKDGRRSDPRPEQRPDAPKPGPEYGDEMTDAQPPGPQADEDAPEESAQAAPSTAAAEAPPDDAEREAAKRALNRLKDQPGKALMPAPRYGRPAVEKDW